MHSKSLLVLLAILPLYSSFSPFLRSTLFHQSRHTLLQGVDDGQDWSQVDKLLEIAKRGPEDEDDLRRIAEEVIDDEEERVASRATTVKSSEANDEDELNERNAHLLTSLPSFAPPPLRNSTPPKPPSNSKKLTSNWPSKKSV